MRPMSSSAKPSMSEVMLRIVAFMRLKAITPGIATRRPTTVVTSAADIEGAIVRRENATQIRNISLSKGMKTLREDGWAKVFAGVTSVKEILRVTEDQ